MGGSELRRVQQVAGEKQPLKQLAADLSLDKQLLPDVLKQPTEARTARHPAPALERRFSAPSGVSEVGEKVARGEISALGGE